MRGKDGYFHAEKETEMPIAPFPGLGVWHVFKDDAISLATIKKVEYDERTQIIRVYFNDDSLCYDIATFKASDWKVFAMRDGVEKEV